MLEGDITVAFAFLSPTTNQYRSSKELAISQRCHLKAQDDGVRASCVGCHLHPVDEAGVILVFAVDLAAWAGAERAASIIDTGATVGEPAVL
jgi:hypothetical protein